MRFRIEAVSQTPKSVLLYRWDEYSFDTEPVSASGVTSVLLNDLNLEVEETGRVTSIWGYCPHTNWKKTKLEAPEDAELGSVFFESDVAIEPGISIRMTKGPYLNVLFDRAAGWVCIRDKLVRCRAVKVLPGVIFEIDNGGQLCALWLKPRWIGNVDEP